MANNDMSMDWEPAEPTTSSNTSVVEMLNVRDGCANRLIFIKKVDGSVIFEYKPVKPLYSCSGVYDGGEPVLKNLESSEWTKLLNSYQNAKIKGEVGEHGPKGTLVLKYESGTIYDSCTVNRYAEFNQELTTFFHEYRK
jgi:hypothetical protein